MQPDGRTARSSLIVACYVRAAFRLARCSSTTPFRCVHRRRRGLTATVFDEFWRSWRTWAGVLLFGRRAAREHLCPVSGRLEPRQWTPEKANSAAVTVAVAMTAVHGAHGGVGTFGGLGPLVGFGVVAYCDCSELAGKKPLAPAVAMMYGAGSRGAVGEDSRPAGSEIATITGLKDSETTEGSLSPSGCQVQRVWHRRDQDSRCRCRYRCWGLSRYDTLRTSPTPGARGYCF